MSHGCFLSISQLDCMYLSKHACINHRKACAIGRLLGSEVPKYEYKKVVYLKMAFLKCKELGICLN